MSVQGLDHYNLRAPRELLDRLRDWYRDVIGLEGGERPPFPDFMATGSTPAGNGVELDFDARAGD